MLTQKDRDAIRDLVRTELSTALDRKITIERGPRQPGDPEKVVKEESWNVLDFLAVYLPKIEAALRGLQEDLDKTKNHVAGNNERLEAIGSALIGMEAAAKQLAEFSDRVKMIKGNTESSPDSHKHILSEALTPHEETGHESHTR